MIFATTIQFPRQQLLIFTLVSIGLEKLFSSTTRIQSPLPLKGLRMMRFW
ncbi:hypothetical protein BofuT4_uP025910.1 [Botrytis cinerea T4]|uniref:Uncharacterized protein n=1 Tax=Botryotinia fuckeliana (strain T4) TaxID=999810 RepID=G2YEJ4_BOTF4|nr:hypothetical protein BofuT4_uP025910.1 [Botrytis cinerea T4]